MTVPKQNNMAENGYQPIRIRIRERHGDHWIQRIASDSVSEECPVALVYNGISHAVMMATPTDLEDFALGFSLSERIITEPDQIFETGIFDHGEQGIELQMHIHGACANDLKMAHRNLVGPTGCGLCGKATLEQVRQPLPVRQPRPLPGPEPIQTALTGLDQHQRLQQLTGTMHAACWCDSEGRIQLLREDVGRHNALDKLIGALKRSGLNRCDGFALVSSRGSYEMVAKAAEADLGTLVTVSGVTAMAIRDARQAGLNLIGFARRGRQVVYTSGDSSNA
ncbi:formate dehydrogenase subunit FdhD [Marinobacter lipolyticus SM19]|uniref:Sulfur carrier protein FdhD n=1 Tax=Marinobacter lipolyticus SM19 TaxID=1318628 RepID=R8B4S3_9GAMM|nr:formate dehydrogenase accessory sulfurtransferase FdhD [Marinobacter lipolyticus]EON93566.1 formate dehydrogenase subunit FdhD [Marinobacter lipolyticus SM19]